MLVLLMEKSIEEVIINAKDVLEGTIFSLLKNNLKVSEFTLTRPSLESNEFLVYIDIQLTPIIDKVKNQTIKKTLTIPKWLNDEAEKHSVNFSNLLQTTIKKYLNIQENQSLYGGFFFCSFKQILRGKNKF